MSDLKLEVNQTEKGELKVSFFIDAGDYRVGSYYDVYALSPKHKGYVKRNIFFGIIGGIPEKVDKVYKTLGQVHQQICKDYPGHEVIYNLNIKSRTHGQSHKGQETDGDSKRLLCR